MVQIYPAGDEYRLVTPMAAFTASRTELYGKELTCSLNSTRVTATLVRYGEQVILFYGGEMYHVRLPDPDLGDSDFSGADSSLRAPIPGKVTKVVGTAGTTVRKGEPLLVLEAMKMEYVIRAPLDGQVVAMLFQEGDMVQERDRLVEFSPVKEHAD